MIMKKKNVLYAKMKKGYVKNESENNFVKELLGMLTKKEEQEKLKEHALSINNTNININNNLNSGNDINKKNTDINHNNNNKKKQTNLINASIISYKQQKQLLQRTQLFLIKLFNIENIQKSKNIKVMQ